MSIVKINGDLSGRPVVFGGVRITQIEIDNKFINTIPHPMPTKDFCSEDDIVSIICEAVLNKKQKPDRIGVDYSEKFGEVLKYRETFIYHNNGGEILFSVFVTDGSLIIDHVEYNIVKTLKGII